MSRQRRSRVASPPRQRGVRHSSGARKPSAPEAQAGDPLPSPGSHPRVCRWILAAGFALIWAAGCSAPAPRSDDPWSQGLAAALAARAGELLADGRTSEARDMALEAWDRAQMASDGRSQGLALAVLGAVDRDSVLLAEARQVLQLHATLAETWELALVLADVLLDEGRTAQALSVLDPVVTAAESHHDPAIRAAIEARARRLRSVALRRQGWVEEGRADDRRAQLVLSLLPDAQLMELRLILALVLGDDLLAEGHPADAYARHTRARTLAERLGDGASEARALCAQAYDLAALGRFADAADRALLGAEHAEVAGQAALTRQAALSGLGWCDDAGMALDDRRRQPLLLLLRRLDQDEVARTRSADG